MGRKKRDDGGRRERRQRQRPISRSDGAARAASSKLAWRPPHTRTPSRCGASVPLSEPLSEALRNYGRRPVRARRIPVVDGDALRFTLRTRPLGTPPASRTTGCRRRSRAGSPTPSSRRSSTGSTRRSTRSRTSASSACCCPSSSSTSSRWCCCCAIDPWLLVSPWDYPLADLLLPITLEFCLVFCGFPLMLHVVNRRVSSVQERVRAQLDEASQRHGARGLNFQLKQSIVGNGAGTNMWVEVQVLPLLQVKQPVPVPVPTLYPVLVPSDPAAGAASPSPSGGAPGSSGGASSVSRTAAGKQRAAAPSTPGSASPPRRRRLRPPPPPARTARRRWRRRRRRRRRAAR